MKQGQSGPPKALPPAPPPVPSNPRRATDKEVLEWAKRHDLPCWDHLSEARAAFEDAQTLHLADGVPGPDDQTNPQQTPMEEKRG